MIDRKSLVQRHNPVLRSADPNSPFSVGNGEFAFTADVTGLQTFHRHHESAVPLCTMAQWGWHSSPHEPPIAELRGSLAPEMFETSGRMVPYETSSAGQENLFNTLRENPHRLNLGTLGFAWLTGNEVDPGEVSSARQELDLWTGKILSRSELRGRRLEVQTICDPVRDAVAFRATSPLIAKSLLGVRLKFSYGSPAIHASDWESPESHVTRLSETGPGTWRVERRLDESVYRCVIHGDAGLQVDLVGLHEIELRNRSSANALSAVIEFLPGQTGQTGHESLTFNQVQLRSEKHWEQFWSVGGCVELAGSRDPRATEIERRVVLSRYLTAIQCSGSLPPQETGLTCNSWYGKFHLEMHVFHAAHFALWGNPEFLMRSMEWYRSILPRAQSKATLQGYRGARWPKMTDPAGHESPSSIGPLLIWQQPHLLTLLEYLHRAQPGLPSEAFMELVEQTADFMTSFAEFDEGSSRTVLGPPVMPAQERHDARTSRNPTFELEYWRTGLSIAQLWRKRAGLPPNQSWQRTMDTLSQLPQIELDGIPVYAAHEACPHTFADAAEDHPSMLCALGLLPGTGVDATVMGNTLDAVLQRWNLDETWGWDFPTMAMTAARLGRPNDAVELLVLDRPKNTYLANGHNPQLPKPDLPLYLPGNGSFLLAVAMMTAGWDGCSARTPGFPDDGRWRVEWESILPTM